MFWRWCKRALVFGVILVLLGTVCLFGAFFMFTKNVRAEAGQVEDRLMVADSRPSVIVSADGRELFRVSSDYRKPFTLEDVPQRMRNAMVAAEDRRFYDHNGVDYIGLARISFLAAREGRASQGGSTITMQLAKQLLTSSDRSLQRKLKDIALAGELENLKTKDQLLELYLKSSYFGEGANGLASAADVYFGKEIKDLTLAECAMLARCVRRPSDQNPVKNYETALKNAHVVLDIMLSEGMIERSEYDAAKRERPKVRKEQFTKTLVKGRAGYFVDYVLRTLRQEMPADFDIKRGGYRIETTIRMDLQTYAEKRVKQVVDENRRNRVSSGAFVLMDNYGEILVMVGGQDYNKSQYNLVTQGRRQPGSSFKAIVYATALDRGTIHPGSELSNARIHIKTGPGRYYDPKNSGRWDAGSYPLEVAFANSINRPALWTYYNTGKENVVDYAKKVFGFESDLKPIDSLALGSMPVHPLEMAEAYSVFALHGDRAQPFGIRRVLAPDGSLVREFRPSVIQGVLAPGTADAVGSLMRRVVERGTGTAARGVPDAHGKTGTTNDNADAWFCGFARNLVGIGWIGNADSNRSMASSIYGGTVTVKFWADIMNYALDNVSPRADIEASAKIAPPEKPAAPPRDEQKPIPDEAAPIDTPPVVDRHPDTTDPDEGTAEEPLDPASGGRADPDAPVTNGDPKPDPVSTPPVDPPRKGPSEPSRPRPAEREVTVEICAESGELATMYCPETVTRTYPAGKAPRKRCPIHRG